MREPCPLCQRLLWTAAAPVLVVYLFVALLLPFFAFNARLAARLIGFMSVVLALRGNTGAPRTSFAFISFPIVILLSGTCPNYFLSAANM